jgi:hypothetical protein
MINSVSWRYGLMDGPTSPFRLSPANRTTTLSVLRAIDETLLLLTTTTATIFYPARLSTNDEPLSADGC